MTARCGFPPLDSEALRLLTFKRKQGDSMDDRTRIAPRYSIAIAVALSAFLWGLAIYVVLAWPA